MAVMLCDGAVSAVVEDSDHLHGGQKVIARIMHIAKAMLYQFRPNAVWADVKQDRHTRLSNNRKRCDSDPTRHDTRRLTPPSVHQHPQPPSERLLCSLFRLLQESAYTIKCSMVLVSERFLCRAKV